MKNNVTLMKSKYSTILCLLLLSSTNQLNFEFDIEPKKMKCFGEYLSESSTTKVTLNSLNNQYFQSRVYDPNGNTIFSKESKYDVKLNIIASETGIFQFCFDNFNKAKISLKINILSGVAARDYSSLTKVGKLKPIEVFLTKLTDSVDYMIKEVGIIFSEEIENRVNSNDHVSYSIFNYSLIVFCIIIAVNVVEVVILRRFVDHRKRI